MTLHVFDTRRLAHRAPLARNVRISARVARSPASGTFVGVALGALVWCAIAFLAARFVGDVGSVVLLVLGACTLIVGACVMLSQDGTHDPDQV